RLQLSPELRDVASDLQTRALQARLVIDRSTAGRFGITTQMIDDTLYDAFGQRQISTMFTEVNQYKVVLEVQPEFKQSPEALKNIYVQTASGGAVPLSVFTRLETLPVPLAVNRQAQFPAATISFNVAPGVSLGQAVARIERDVTELKMPDSIHGSFRG